MPIDGFLNFDRTRNRDSLADLVLDIVLAPLEKIMIPLAPAHDAVVIADPAQYGLKFAGIFGNGRSQHRFAERHAIKPVITRDELFRPARSADQRKSEVTGPAQRCGDKIDPLRNRAFRARFLDKVCNPSFGGPTRPHARRQQPAGGENAQDVAAIEGRAESHRDPFAHYSLTTTSRSTPDSAPQTSPGRPSSCRTDAPRLSLGKPSNVSETGSKRRMALARKSVTQTLSLLS